MLTRISRGPDRGRSRAARWGTRRRRWWCSCRWRWSAWCCSAVSAWPWSPCSPWPAGSTTTGSRSRLQPPELVLSVWLKEIRIRSSRRRSRRRLTEPDLLCGEELRTKIVWTLCEVIVWILAGRRDWMWHRAEPCGAASKLPVWAECRTRLPSIGNEGSPMVPHWSARTCISTSDPWMTDSYWQRCTTISPSPSWSSWILDIWWRFCCPTWHSVSYIRCTRLRGSGL